MTYNNLSLSNFVEYLRDSGWDYMDKFANPNLLVFSRRLIDESSISVLLPAKEDFSDYDQRVHSALGILSSFEDRSVDAIVKDITNFSSLTDKLEIRIISSFSEDGAIPLSYAASLIKGLKNLIVSAAYTEELPQRVFKRASQKAQSYSDSFKLGQTAHGSYIVTVESGSLENDDLAIAIEGNTLVTEPFSRRVMKRIHRSMYQIESFNEENNKLSDLVETGYNEGINANICDALLSLYYDNELMKLESKIKYSKSLKNTEELPEKITLNSADYYIIKVLAEALRENKPEDIELEGYISKLSSNSELTHGSINIISIHENKKHSIKLELNEDDYKRACDAHKEKKQVRITGIIDTSGKTWEVTNLTKFQVL
ncbi:hypothetical protein [Paenibacillus sp. MER 99-2]|uniref:hypothetical protein n=1 Tax=Paenibacillus sp. MER 99-2 TaxID=2939572 RepID=UPI00203E6701|nr:hypothetical protein [Paenibacillus sp. MER 99-2]MCM3175927.1 hypothetical protein [Paenibacillus sp. MER 99-2]